MAYKRTTRSGPSKTRTTITQSCNRKGIRSSKISYSTGGSTNRVTRTTNLNTGETKTYVTNRSGGWIDRKCISPPKSKTSSTKFPKAKTYRKRKSKPMKNSTMMWLLFGLIILMAIS